MEDSKELESPLRSITARRLHRRAMCCAAFIGVHHNAVFTGPSRDTIVNSGPSLSRLCIGIFPEPKWWKSDGRPMTPANKREGHRKASRYRCVELERYLGKGRPSCCIIRAGRKPISERGM
jgi:hypothetical protein